LGRGVQEGNRSRGEEKEWSRIFHEGSGTAKPKKKKTACYPGGSSRNKSAVEVELWWETCTQRIKALKN